MEQELYTAGFARLDITPPLGVPINGYFYKRIGKGVLDPLFVNAVAFGEGEKRAVLLVLDMMALPGQVGYEWSVKIARELGLSEQSVFLCCTHTHTAPLVEGAGSDEMYDAWLLRRLCDAVTIALDDCKPVVDVQWVQERAEGLAFPRRYVLNDGTVMTNPAGTYREQIREFACENDDTLRLIRILREGGPELTIVNFQSHPDNIGGEFYSADYPGAFRNRVELGREGVRCIFLDGAEGQMVASDRRKGPKEPASHEKAMRYGARLGDFVLDIFDKTVSTGQKGLYFGQAEVRLKTKRDPSRVPEARRILELHEQGKDEQIHPFKKQAIYMVAEAGQLCRLEKTMEDYRDVPVSAVAFCGLALGGIPGEPFNEVGVQVRANSKFAATCVCCLTNGSHGYFPTAQAYEQGGYEVYNTPYVKGCAEQLADGLDRLLESF